MDTNADRFLTAFNEIEKWLRKILGADRRVTFYNLVDDASQSKYVSSQIARIVTRYENELKGFGDLRNAIVHEHRNDEVIATPNLKAVEEVEALRDHLFHPQKIHPLFARDVLICSPDDSIGTVAQQMRDKKFSQVPVYSAKRLFALLTSDTIARWVACSLGKGETVMADATVKTVLNEAEFTNNYVLLDPGATVIDALECFDTHLHGGKRLDAILISKDAKKTNLPIGIISVSDLPQLLESLA